MKQRITVAIAQAHEKSRIAFPIVFHRFAELTYPSLPLVGLAAYTSE
jgi:hypothetical protein